MPAPYTIVKSISRLRIAIDNFLVRNIEKSGAKGLMVSHGNILMQLYKKDKRPMSKIAEDIGKCKSTLTTLVNKLEKSGFIAREVSAEDVRIKNLCLTDKGKRFEKHFWSISEELNSTLWEGFTPDEQKLFLTYLERMQINLNKKEQIK